MEDGQLKYSVDGESVVLLDIRVNDGRWHNVAVKWMVGDVFLSLDYGQYEVRSKSSSCSSFFKSAKPSVYSRATEYQIVPGDSGIGRF